MDIQAQLHVKILVRANERSQKPPSFTVLAVLVLSIYFIVDFAQSQVLAT